MVEKYAKNKTSGMNTMSISKKLLYNEEIDIDI